MSHIGIAARLTLTVVLLSLAGTGAMAQAQDAQALRKACGGDLQKYCSGIQPGGGRVAQCLQSHAAELSPDCKAAYDAAGQKAKDRRG